ncbi:MAG: sulfatase [Proteobacteria bacterium]|nr:sulfatase [Pseudomonadota bacterium]MCP4915951.1 sulfatase [Pseudomonadota bacterium]
MILALLACTSKLPTPPPPVQRDVVLVSIDTLRADHVGVYGYGRDTTPFLDELAAKGLVYTDARSPTSWTLPTHLTMLSGKLPLHHGVVDDKRKVPDDLPLLAERMQAAGFATVGVVTTFFVSQRFGFDRGFDFWDDFDIHSKKRNQTETPDAEQAVNRVLKGVRSHPDQPVFVFLHLYDVHYPYAAPGDWEERFDRKGTDDDLSYSKYSAYLEDPVEPDQMAHQVAQYDEELAYVDSQLRRLHEAFLEAGRDPLMVITADHGEEFGERGSWGHAHTLNPEQLHVPLIISGPGVPVGRVTTRVGTQDIAPTLAALHGQPMSTDGVPLSLDPETPPPERDFLSDTSRFDTNRVALYHGELRYDWDLVSDEARLYADPGETVDVAAERPDDAQALRAALIQQLGVGWEGTTPTTNGAIFAQGQRVTFIREPTLFQVIPVDAEVTGAEPLHLGAAEIELTEDEKKMLQSLGYMQ